MTRSPWYPELNVGDFVLFAVDPSSIGPKWRLGQVTCLKNDSCDIRVFGTRDEERHDCFYYADPRCKSTREWAAHGRGIFKLAPSEIERREVIRLLPYVKRLPAVEEAMRRLDEKVRRLEVMLEQHVLQTPQTRRRKQLDPALSAEG